MHSEVPDLHELFAANALLHAANGTVYSNSGCKHKGVLTWEYHIRPRQSLARELRGALDEHNVLVDLYLWVTVHLRQSQS